MKFLLDVNMPPSLGIRLEALGHTYRWVPLIMAPTSPDEHILQEASAHDEIILTHDTDFGTLLSFANTRKPSVVLFRINKINAARFFNLLAKNWAMIEHPLSEGAFVVFEEDKFRIRKLPFRTKN